MNRKNIALALAGIGLYFWASRASRRYRIHDKLVFITGGSRGLGLALARQFAEEGADVAICARDHNEVERALAELRHRHCRVLGLSADFGDPHQAEEVIHRIRQHFGRLDVVVNNAGIIQVGPMEAMSLDDFHSTMNDNFGTAVNVITAALPHLKQVQGRIVNIASIGGKIAVPHLLPYCASKFALVGYSRGLRHELAKDGVTVTTVCPGLMRTGSHGNALFKGGSS